MKFLLLLITLVSYSAAVSVKTYIPVKAYKYQFVVYKEAGRLMPKFDEPWYFQSLIEKESCVRLSGNSYWARRCWSPKSKLKTKREEGAGLGQLTRAWKKDGRLRFDTIANLKRKYPKELNQLTWDNVYDKPVLQIRAMILLWRSNYNIFSDTVPEKSRMYFASSIYNGGYKYFSIERKRCGLTKGCDPNLWFGNVADMKSKRARRKLYGNRTAWDINRNHEHSISIRIVKYKKLYKSIRECNITNEGNSSK